jgi:hypothetical protein
MINSSEKNTDHTLPSFEIVTLYEFERGVCYCWFKPLSQNLVPKIMKKRKQFSGSMPDLVPHLGTCTHTHEEIVSPFTLQKILLKTGN